MDIVLNGFCKRFVSVYKTLAKSTTCRCYPHYPQLPVDNSNPTICLWITFYGGEGVRSVGDNCGYILYTEKVKSRKRATSPLPATKKGGVGGFHKAGLGRNPTTKNSRDADTLPTNKTESCYGCDPHGASG